jgi:hypothetical protein
MNWLIIYDFDGVIADSEVLANGVLAQFITELGVPTTLENSYRLYMGKRFNEVMAAIETWLGHPVHRILVPAPIAWPYASTYSNCTTTSPGLQRVGRYSGQTASRHLPSCCGAYAMRNRRTALSSRIVRPG